MGWRQPSWSARAWGFVCVLAISAGASALEVIVDNNLPGTTTVGSWPAASGANAHFGTTSRYAVVGGATDTYRFTPTLPVADSYDVHAWNSCYAPRHTAVPHRISHQGGVDIVFVDQHCGSGVSGAWLFLGTYGFSAGSGGFLEITDAGLSPALGAYIGADAVRFTTTGNMPALVDAGPDLNVLMSTPAAIDATVADDGLVAPLTLSWSQQSGLGTAIFDDAGAEDVSVSFTATGIYVLRLTAFDGSLTAFDDVDIAVTSPGNTPPLVEAGADQHITLPATATLDGTVNDDGLIAPLTLIWSDVGATGLVTLGDASAEDTTASFALPGTYTLRLTAFDGELPTEDELVVVASPESGVEVIVDNDLPGTTTVGSWPVASGASAHFGTPSRHAVVGGATDTYRFTPTLPAAGTYDVHAWNSCHAAGHTAVSHRIFYQGGVDTVIVDQHCGSGASGAWLYLGTYNFSAGTTGFLEISDEGLSSAMGAYIGADAVRFTTTGALLRTISANAKGGTPNGRPSTDAGPDQTITLPASVVLDGTSTDDGQLFPLTFAWSQDAGPGVAVFADAAAEDTTATLPVAGLYKLRLTVWDGARSAFDRVSVTVEPGNMPAVVDAGPDLNVVLPMPAVVDATVTDDGLVAPLTLSWSQESGPGIATFDDPGVEDVTVSFTSTGVYVLRLTAFDGSLTTFDDLTVVVTSPNTPPLVNAGADQNITLPGTATLDATVSDDGLIAPITLSWSDVGATGQVTFGAASAEDTTASFALPGTYTLRLTAFDGSLTTSDELTVLVTPANTAPLVNAGADQNITLPGAATLDGTVSDDGLIAPLTLNWSDVGATGQVMFGDPSVEDTIASFGLPGTYTLRLTAFDGSLSTSDDLIVVVAAANTPPVVNAGADQNITLPATATLDGTASDDGLIAPLTLSWSDVGATGQVTFGDADVEDTTASFALPGTYTLRLTAFDGSLTSSDDLIVVVTAANTAPLVNSGADQNITLPGTATLDATVSDDGLIAPLTLSWSDVGATGQVTFGDPAAEDTSASFALPGTYTLRLTAFDGSLSTSDDLIVVVTAANTAPLVNAGADQNITLPGTATLDGTVSDDGLVAPLTLSWSDVGATGQVTFGDPAAEDTSASFALPGTYTLRLTAFDGSLSTSDDLIVVVTATNTAPLVNAGADQNITLPGTATLDATVSDDGLIAPLTLSWSDVGATGQVTFGDPAAEDTSASFALPGTYTLRLTAFDGSLTSSDDLIVVVTAANTAPLVNAGADQNITLPGTATLDGTVSDDGLVAPITLNWSDVGATGQVTFGDPSAEDTSANFASPGTYTLRLTAFDGSLTTFDELDVSVSLAGNSAPLVDAGADQGIALSETAVLDGLVTDDGLVVPYTVTWTDVGSTGLVVFTDPNSEDTAANFLVPGTYTLRLTAFDGELMGQDDLVVSVLPDAGIEVIVDNNLAGTSSVGAWPAATGANAHYGTTSLYAVVGGSIDAYRFTPTLLVAGDYSVDAWNSCYSPRHTAVPHRISHDGGISTVVVDQDCGSGVSGAWLTLGTYSFSAGTSGYVEITDEGLTSALGQYIGADAVRFTTVGAPPTNLPPTTDAGPDQTITLPTGALLDGTSADDGQLAPLTFAWTQVSGPGTAQFANANQEDTSVTFSVAGVYELRLTVTDGEHASTDTLFVTVQPGNLPPVVDAGADINVVSPVPAVIDATVTDDGLVAPLTLSWSQQSGPGIATFDDASVEDVTVTFSGTGTYVLRLTAFDGSLTTFDDVSVTVASSGNTAPVVAAGADQSIELTEAALLDGLVTDDGLVAPFTVSWSDVGSTGQVSFADAGSENTSATFLTAGTYTLRLTAFDGELSSQDELVVTVGAQSTGAFFDFDTFPVLTSYNPSAVPDVGVRGGRFYAEILTNESEQTLWDGPNQGRVDGRLFDLPVEVIGRGMGVAPIGDDSAALPYLSSYYAKSFIQVHDEDPSKTDYLHVAVGHRGGPNTIEDKRTNSGSTNAKNIQYNAHNGRADVRLVVNADGSHETYWQQSGTVPDDWQPFVQLAPGIPFFSTGRVWVNIGGDAYLTDAVPFTAVIDSVEINEL